MSDQFKIRKNKSQKEINFNHENSRKTPTLTNPKPTKSRPTSNFYTYKVAHLEPLLKTKAFIHHNSDNNASLKLEYTQPVPQKSFSINKYELKSQAFHLIPLDINIPAKTSSIDKQNRPASINEVKYPTITKVQSNLLKTDKYQSTKLFANLVDGHWLSRNDKENNVQVKKGQLDVQKISKKQLLKTTSRSKLAKMQGITQQNPIVVYQTEVQTEPDMNNYRTFRKGIINKIFCHQKNNEIISEHHQINENWAQNEQKKAQKDRLLTEDIKDDKNISQELLHSPIMKKQKQSNLYWANCSTIREQQESCCSVVSRQALEQLINFNITSEPSPFIEHKGMDRRRKVQNDRIKKKFPENFFK